MPLITLARQLGAAIQQSEEYMNYKTKEQNMQCDKQLQKIIEEFNLKKVNINHELSKEPVNQEKIDNLNADIGELYSKINQSETMRNYTEAKQKFESVLQKVSFIINSASSGQDPMLVDVDANSACTGNCSGCAGCA